MPIYRVSLAVPSTLCCGVAAAAAVGVVIVALAVVLVVVLAVAAAGRVGAGVRVGVRAGGVALFRMAAAVTAVVGIAVGAVPATSRLSLHEVTNTDSHGESNALGQTMRNAGLRVGLYGLHRCR